MSSNPETFNTLMLIFSDCGTPKSYRHSNIFSVNAYKFVKDDVRLSQIARSLIQSETDVNDNFSPSPMSEFTSAPASPMKPSRNKKPKISPAVTLMLSLGTYMIALLTRNILHGMCMPRLSNQKRWPVFL